VTGDSLYLYYSGFDPAWVPALQRHDYHGWRIRSRLACSAYRLAMSDGGGPRRLLRRFLQTRQEWN
jgi:hypothetical protein